MRRKQQQSDKHKNKVISSRKGANRIGTINKKLPRKKTLQKECLVETKRSTSIILPARPIITSTKPRFEGKVRHRHNALIARR